MPICPPLTRDLRGVAKPQTEYAYSVSLFPQEHHARAPNTNYVCYLLLMPTTDTTHTTSDHLPQMRPHKEDADARTHATGDGDAQTRGTEVKGFE